MALLTHLLLRKKLFSLLYSNRKQTFGAQNEFSCVNSDTSIMRDRAKCEFLGNDFRLYLFQ
jgi:hypothetical protein